MIMQTEENGKHEMEAGRRFAYTLTKLNVASLLKQANIRKDDRKVSGEKGSGRRSAYAVFTFLIMLVFQGQNLFRYLSSKKHDCACSKNTYYRVREGNCHD